jgi:hypothetical protein
MLHAVYPPNAMHALLLGNHSWRNNHAYQQQGHD